MILVEIDGIEYDAEELIAKYQQQVLPQRFERLQSVIKKRNKNLVTVMENIYDRGNTSAVMRSAEAFGFHLFHQIVAIDTFKESKRVTQGADKWLLQTHWEQTKPCIQNLKEKGYKVLVTHLEGGKPIQEVDFSTPVALCFGNEKEGASETLTNLAHEKIYIPMQGFVQSFNISVAAALCFQHIQREMLQYSLPKLSEVEEKQLLATYLHRSCEKEPGVIPG